MTFNFMEQSEKDLSFTLEGDWSLPVIITRKSDSVTQTLNGQVLFDTVNVDENGIPTIDNTPIVSLRKSTLTIEPVDGEVWYFDIPEKPSPTASVKRHIFGVDDAKRGFTSIGIVTYPVKLYEDERT
jgi:hypothetical protein